MATTPEEFFVEGLMEPEPPSPSIFIVNLPPTPDPSAHSNSVHGEGQLQLISNDLALSYISQMLMQDDDMDGKNDLHEHSDDDPALQQVQQPFAQILSSTSLGSSGDQGMINKGNTRGKGCLKLNTERGCTVDEIWACLMKAMGKVGMFLPRDNNSEAAMVMAELEEIGTQEIFDEMMLHGYETSIQDMGKLRIAMANETDQKDNKKGRSKARRKDVVDLLTLLMRCAQAVDEGMSASKLLMEIKQHASATGDAMQRLAQCFSKGLEMRLAGMGSKVCVAERPSVIEFLRAYKLYMAASCFNRVPLVFNIKTTLHAIAAAGKSKLHIVDYGLDYGFRWAGLLRWLAIMEGGPQEVKITAIGRPGPRSYQGDQIEEAGRQLSDCARVFGLPSFRFHVILAQWEAVCIDHLNKDADEVLIVNDLFNFSTLMEEGIYSDAPSPRDIVLKNIRNMRPDVFIQGIMNCSYGSSSLSRFREALYYYSAMFDMLDATMPLRSKQRLVLEQHVLGPCALNVITCEGSDRMYRPDTYKQWQLRNQRAGLRQLPLHRKTVNMVRDDVLRHYGHKDFVIDEDHQWLLQGWKGRILYAHSTWVADDA